MSAGAVSGPMGGPFTVSGSHIYADEGTYTIAVGVHDDGGSTATLSGTATVADGSLAATGNPNLLSTNPLSGTLATFTDVNPLATTADFTATIDWGDGTTSTGAVTGPTGGPFTVSGSHTYATLGPETVTVHIVDDGGSKATAMTNVLVYGLSSGGTFVVGDNSATGAVTFWGAQWAKVNRLSRGDAPSSFKGFEDHPTTAICGTSWTTDPGNSAGPPGTIPTYMAVIVASSVAKSGSTISGNTIHVVIVKTDQGYAANPGHTGTVVASLC
jgi:hypothetical protein